MTTWVDISKPRLPGYDLVTNGTFTGNANGWTLGNGWSYGTNNITYTPFGSEMITNGSFTGGITGWSTLNAGGLTWAYGTNNIKLTGTASAGGSATLSQTGLSFTQGQRYRSRLDMTLASGTLGLQIKLGALDLTPSGYYNVTKSYDDIFTLNGTPVNSTYAFAVNTRSGTIDSTYDNLSLTPVNGGTVSQTVPITPNQSYSVSLTVGGTTGSVTLTMGTATMTVLAGNTGTQTLTPTSTSLVITPSDYFDGTIDDISVLTTANLWTDVPKPIGYSSTIGYAYSGGTPIGLLLSLTQTSVIGVTSVITSRWTDVTGHSTIWTDVPNAT